jgi:hypothetical protein
MELKDVSIGDKLRTRVAWSGKYLIPKGTIFTVTSVVPGRNCFYASFRTPDGETASQRVDPPQMGDFELLK